VDDWERAWEQVRKKAKGTNAGEKKGRYISWGKLERRGGGGLCIVRTKLIEDWATRLLAKNQGRLVKKKKGVRGHECDGGDLSRSTKGCKRWRLSSIQKLGQNIEGGQIQSKKKKKGSEKCKL